MKEILEKVYHIEITTSRLVSDVFAGAYHSTFKGRGMEFDEVREYQIGDDIRAIDWNVTARTGVPHIKKYVEERELTMMLVVDASLSVHFASQGQMKNKLAAEIAAVLAFSAIRNNDKVGLMMFTDEVELFIPPRKGKAHVLRLIREILYFKPKAKGTRFISALKYLTQVLRRKAVVFVISDFYPSSVESLESMRKTLRIANKFHDLIAITLNDPRELELPQAALVTLMDAERGNSVVIDTSHPHVRAEYNRKAQERLLVRDRMFDSIGMDHIDVSTHVPYAQTLIRFFANRKRRRTLS